MQRKKSKVESRKSKVGSRVGTGPRVGTVTLWGEILEDCGRDVLMAVVNHGDAVELGISGKVWIAKRQIFGSIGMADGHAFVRLGFAYASLLAQSCQPCE